MRIIHEFEEGFAADNDFAFLGESAEDESCPRCGESFVAEISVGAVFLELCDVAQEALFDEFFFAENFLRGEAFGGAEVAFGFLEDFGCLFCLDFLGFGVEQGEGLIFGDGVAFLSGELAEFGFGGRGEGKFAEGDEDCVERVWGR